MFYSILSQKPADYTLRKVQKFKEIGFLVRIGRRFHVVTPTAHPVAKAGHKQFWFYHNGKALLALQQKDGSWHV